MRAPELAAAIRRRDRIDALTYEAQREHAESLLRGIDALTRKVAAMGPLPLDIVDRYERILTAAHVANLLRVSAFSDAALRESDAGS